MSGPSLYANPHVLPPAPARLRAGQIAVRGMEVVQAIQSLGNDVRLIAGKGTAVRVYLDPEGFPDLTSVTGEIIWRRGTAGAHYLPAMNRVRVGGDLKPTLAGQRSDAELSLNFRLPTEAAVPGVLEVTLHRLQVPGGQNVPFGPPPPVRVLFQGAPPLRVRAIGLRYRSSLVPGAVITPAAVHFAHLRSYLARAYPVAEVEWSQIVIDGDLPSPPFGPNTSNLVNAQLSALRAREISGGMDPRTHYVGLVDDEGGRSFMRGSAVYNAATKVFGPVACSPCGVPNGWSGDADRSYADWYGAHELGHTFQRRHPGFPASKQPRDPDEPGFPYPDGLITTADLRHVGFDIGDLEWDIPMRALPGDQHHDVMTYADRQWLSAYTYEAIHDRLLHEDGALAPAVA